MRKVERISVNCQHCKKIMYVKQSDIDRGRAKHCSRACNNKSRAGVELVNTKVKLICKICGDSFKVSQCRGNKAKYCSSKCFGISEMGKKRHTQKHSIESKIKMSLSRRNKAMGKENGNWKGGVDEYGSIHDWVEVRLGRPKKCDICGSENQRYYDWANKSQQYKRDLNDWLRLCRLCHARYDYNYKYKQIDINREM